jgi:hypothetical protein
VASSYPGSLDSFTTKSNGDTIDASHIDALQDAVVAVETALGVNPLRAAVPTYTFAGTVTVSTGNGGRWYNRTGRTITVSGWDISAETAPTGASLIADVLKNGTTTFSRIRTRTGTWPARRLVAGTSRTGSRSGHRSPTTRAPRRSRGR